MLYSIGNVPKTELYANFVTKRCVTLWNSLPLPVREVLLEEYENNSVFKVIVKEHFNNIMYDQFTAESVCTWVTRCKCSMCTV